MKRSLPIVLGTTLITIALAAAPASADHLTIDDPAGNRSGRGLDIVSATLRSHDHRLVADVEFRRAARGDLIVSVDARHGTGLRLVSQYRPTGHTSSFVIERAFTDGDGQEGSGPERVRCPGFRVRWSPDEPSVRMVLPSRCLHDGRYGGVRFAVLTERSADTDYAPEGAAASDWVPRG